MIVKTGLSRLSADVTAINSNFVLSNKLKPKVGRVFGIITTSNTPTSKQFERGGEFSGMGTIFYRDYNSSKKIVGSLTDEFLQECDIAKPLFPQFSYFPLIGELVYIIDLPSPATQKIDGASQKYYITPINIWTNIQVNAQTPTKEIPIGKTFVEKDDIRNLLSFEGDYILQGRKGNSVRFGTTVKNLSYVNNWSDNSLGGDGDPITIISNGHQWDRSLESRVSQSYFIENINVDASSVYLTTSQKIPLNVSKTNINPITSPVPVKEYIDGSMVVINADRVVLNSKKENLMFFAEKNIEISTLNTINLNADTSIHLNAKLQKDSIKNVIPKIFLGTKENNDLPDEPLLLGTQTAALLDDIITSIAIFAAKLTAVTSTQEGSPITSLQGAGESLYNDITSLYNKIDKILSKQNFTV
jgi:hypothetical protein